MKLELELNDIQDLEYVIALLGYGALSAVDKKAISIYDTERVMFAPRMLDPLAKIRCDELLLDVIHKGLFLEDIEDLLPELLDKKIKEMEDIFLKVLKNIPKKVNPIKQITFSDKNKTVEFFDVWDGPPPL